MADIERFFLSSKMYPVNYGARFRIISVTPKRLLKTQIFEKKGYLPSDKIDLACFFKLSIKTNVRGQFIRDEKV